VSSWRPCLPAKNRETQKILHLECATSTVDFRISPLPTDSSNQSRTSFSRSPPHQHVCFNRMVTEPFNVIVQVGFFFQKVLIDPPILGVPSSRPKTKHRAFISKIDASISRRQWSSIRFLDLSTTPDSFVLLFVFSSSIIINHFNMLFRLLSIRIILLLPVL
jgi:hypothetical protein